MTTNTDKEPDHLDLSLIERQHDLLDQFLAGAGGRVSRQIPYQVKWLLGHVHASTSYRVVAIDIAERIDCHNAIVTRRARARTITDALIQHRRNRAEYDWVMGPH